MTTADRVEIHGMAVYTLPTSELSSAASAHIAAELNRRIGAAGACSVAFSGGSTPNRMLEDLARARVDWHAVDVFQVDERMVPPGHPEHNYAALQRCLLSRIDIPGTRLHPMPTEAADPAAAAARYGQLLDRTVPAGLDIVHLGLGDDGHTASWPPGEESVARQTASVATTGPFNGRLRMTLTPAAVQRAGSIVWLVAGASKAAPLKQLVAGDGSIPARLARREGSVIFADEAAASLLD